ncbi:hypothetical protein ABTP42_19685, partial [Acinetobacter baumannii]
NVANPEKKDEVEPPSRRYIFGETTIESAFLHCASEHSENRTSLRIRTTCDDNGNRNRWNESLGGDDEHFNEYGAKKFFNPLAGP